MQVYHEFERSDALPVGWGVRILVLAGTESDPLVARLGGLGGPVEVETEFYAGLSTLIDDPNGYGLFVMDCDAHGGAEAARRALAMLRGVQARARVILVSRDHVSQDFPQDTADPVRLRAPVSAVSLRVGFEHALRDRLIWQAA